MNAQFIEDIGKFIFVCDTPAKADAIFLPGGPHPEPAEYAAELIKHFVCSKDIADAMRRA